MVKPIRIQRKRTKGWRMPDNTVYVGRGSRWGNPHKAGDIVHDRNEENRTWEKRAITAKAACAMYAKDMLPYEHQGPDSTLEKFYISEANLTDIQDTLRGKNLACWCPLDQPCHADFLLRIANADR